MLLRNTQRRKTARINVESLEGRALLSTTAALANEDVSYLYENLLQRAPTPSEVSFFGSNLDKGVNPANVYNTFVNSTEHQGLVTSGQYTGTPLSTTNVSSFDSQFAQAVTNANAGANVNGLSLGSSTNVNTYVNSLYTGLMGRTPSSDETAYWAGQIADGMSLNSVVSGFLNSTEYNNNLTSNTAPYQLGTGTNGDLTEANTFVNSLYSGVLGRTASSAETSYWAGRIQNGMSANNVIAGFLTSPEYRQNTVGTVSG